MILRGVALYLYCLVALVGSGCATGSEIRLYILTPMTPQEVVRQSSRTDNLAIGVGPVQLPRYTSRPAIVTADNSHELHRATTAQWAEPLQDNFVRVLADNLSLLLATDRVELFPWKSPPVFQYQIIVEVTHLLGTPGGETSLIALWNIIGKDGKTVLASKKASFREPVASQEYAALAAAMSRTVADLSRDIAATIATLP